MSLVSCKSPVSSDSKVESVSGKLAVDPAPRSAGGVDSVALDLSALFRHWKVWSSILSCLTSRIEISSSPSEGSSLGAS
jgi:hypothetical protein